MNDTQQASSKQQLPARREISESEFEALRLEEILAIYKRWYRLSIIAFFAILVPATIVIFLILPLYSANGTVWVNRLTPQSQYGVQQGGPSAGTTFRNLDRQEEIATYAEMIKARPIAVATIDRLGITIEKLNHIHDARRYVRMVMDGVLNGARFVYNETKYFLGLSKRLSPEAEAALARVKLIDEVIDRIEVEPVTDSNIIQVSFKSSDPVLAKDAANVLLDEFLSFSSTIREERAKSFFTTSTEELRDSLAGAEAELLELQKKYDSYSVDQQRNVLVTNYAQAKNLLRSMSIKQASLEAKIRAYRKTLEEEPERILKQEQGVGEIKEGIVWEANPVHQELKLSLHNAEVDLVAAKKEAASTATMLDKYVEDLKALGDADLKIKSQQRAINQLEEAYQINLRNLDGASAIQAMNLASLSVVRVVSYAPYPLKPIRPRRLWYLMFAFAGALIAALAMPFMAYLNDSSIADASDVKKYLGLDFVTIFPDLDSSIKKRA